MGGRKKGRRGSQKERNIGRLKEIPRDLGLREETNF